MKIWSALIVDDELPARMELKRMLEAYPMVDVRGEAGSMQEAQEAIAALNPDLLFLDIDLGSHSGFDLLERAAPTFRVIFINRTWDARLGRSPKTAGQDLTALSYPAIDTPQEAQAAGC